MSELTLTAAAEDNGSNLTCRAENAEMSLAGAEHRAVKEASLKLNVMCKFYNLIINAISWNFLMLFLKIFVKAFAFFEHYPEISLTSKFVLGGMDEILQPFVAAHLFKMHV